MKTRYQLTVGMLFAALLTTLTLSGLGAAPTDPGRELTKTVLAVPEIPHGNIKPHSDAWNDFYLDKFAATSFPIDVEQGEAEPVRGGIAEAYAAKPQARVFSSAAPHSQAWDTFQLDRNVNTQLPNVWNIPAVSLDGKHAGGAIGKNLNRWDLLP
jgi:hypothetical protein